MASSVYRLRVSMHRIQSQKDISMLSQTQGLILELMQTGKTDKEIAKELNIARGTFSNTLHRIKKKFGVTSRYELPGIERKLTKLQRCIVEMKTAGKSYNYISKELNISIGAASSVVSRLRRHKLLLDKPHRSGSEAERV